ncbi:MAG: hypothetical protein GY862_06620, partial [Gammaproteobacteria bacterium]|nr:hypothetical protein [Gammaproteobacteria bacterium]
MTQQSVVSTLALNARGGDIEVRAKDGFYLFNSIVTANAEGEKSRDSGGNLTVARPTFLVLDRGELNASAIAGNGGNITVRAEHFLESNNSIIDASSQKKLPGKVLIDAQETDFGETLVPLPTDYLKETGLKQRCAERLGESESSFIIIHALPVSPYTMRSHRFWTLDKLVQTNGNIQTALS